MSNIIAKVLANLAQQVIVKSLANNPAFQRFALRTANYAKSLEQQVMNAGQQKVNSSASRTTAEAAARQRAQQQSAQQSAQQHQQQQQQQQQHSAGASSDAGLFFHRARAFADALKDEVSKDLGAGGPTKRR